MDNLALEVEWLEQTLCPLPTQGFTDGQSLTALFLWSWYLTEGIERNTHGFVKQ